MEMMMNSVKKYFLLTDRLTYSLSLKLEPELKLMGEITDHERINVSYK